MSIINKIILFLIKGLRPFLGPRGTCRYTVSCSKYAEIQLKEKRLIPAIWSIVKRVLSCGPLKIFFNI